MSLRQHSIIRMTKTLTRLIRQHAPGAFLLSSSIGVFGGLASTASIAYIYEAVKSDAKPHLYQLWIFLALCVAAWLTRTLSQYLLWNGCLRSTVSLIIRLTSSILETPLRKLEEIGSSRLLTALEKDSLSLTDTVITVPLLLLNCTVLLGCAGYLAWQSPIAAIVFIILVVAATGSSLFFMGRMSDLMFRARAQVDKLFEYYRAQSAGVKELKLNARRRADFLSDMQATAELASRLEVSVQTIYAASTGWFQLVFIVPIGVLVFAITNLFPISIAEVGAYALVLLYMISTVNALSAQFETIGRGLIAFTNLEELGLWLEKPKNFPIKPFSERSDSWSQLELIGVTHQFAPVEGQEPFVVGPIDLHFRRGDLVFITGGNGSGKTSFAKLLCGLYVPDSGAIRVDGVSVTAESLEDYRQHFSAVFWDFHIFARLFGLRASDLEGRAREQLAALHLQNKVDIIDGEFTTVNLSQGQRKRLALVVCGLEDRDIYIFDEWAADQDQTFRDHFYYSILSGLRSRGKTVFVISHDERYFGVADRIIKLDLGKVASDTDSGLKPRSAVTTGIATSMK